MADQAQIIILKILHVFLWLIRQCSVADSPSLNLNKIEHFSKVSLSDKPLHFYQVWIYPDQRGLEPSYDQMNCHLTDHPAFLHA
jgi:hypothetical protein